MAFIDINPENKKFKKDKISKNNFSDFIDSSTYTSIMELSFEDTESRNAVSYFYFAYEQEIKTEENKWTKNIFLKMCKIDEKNIICGEPEYITETILKLNNIFVSYNSETNRIEFILGGHNSYFYRQFEIQKENLGLKVLAYSESFNKEYNHLVARDKFPFNWDHTIKVYE